MPIEYFDTNLADLVDKSLWTLSNATLVGDDFIIQPSGYVEVLFDSSVLPTVVSSNLKIRTEFESAESISPYAPTLISRLSILYANLVEYDNLFVPFNKDEVLSLNNYANESVISLDNRQLDSIKLSYYNNSAGVLVVKASELLLSKDIAPTQIANVIKEEVIVADVIQATANFSESVFTQYLKTNIFSASALKTILDPNNEVPHIELFEEEFKVLNTVYSETETEQFNITVNYADGTSETIYFWYAIIGDSPEAFKYLTTIDPRDKYPSISDEDRDAFRFMVRSVVDEGVKVRIYFEDMDDGLGGTVKTPVIIIGRGVDPDPDSPRGQLRMWKQFDGFHQIYTTSDNKEVGFIMDDTGLVTIVGGSKYPLYIKEYDNGIVTKFQGDTLETVIRFILDNWGNITDFLINESLLIPYSQISGDIPQATLDQFIT